MNLARKITIRHWFNDIFSANLRFAMNSANETLIRPRYENRATLNNANDRSQR
jgi:hypothetical protein